MTVLDLLTDYEDLLRQLVNLHATVFETKHFKLPPIPCLSNLLHNPQQFYIIAYTSSEVIGGLTIYLLPSSYQPVSEAYLFDIAVKTSHKKKVLEHG